MSVHDPYLIANQMRAGSATNREIADKLNALGIKTMKGRKWNSGFITALLAIGWKTDLAEATTLSQK